MNLQQHPLSAAFPAMSADDFQALKDSIEAIGVQNPVTLYEGMVIDGWHRYSAADSLGMECPTVDLADIDPRDFVLAQNKARRHITQAQLAMAATAVYAWAPVGNPDLSQSGTECPIGKTNTELAEIAGVGERTIKQAKAVQTKATPEVQAAVKRGDIGLPKAAAIAKLPAEQQAAALSKPAPKQPKKEAEEVQYFGPSPDELDEAVKAAEADTTALEMLMAADDKLAAAVAEIKRLKMQLAAVESARDGYMNRSNELISRINSLKKKIAKLEAVSV